MKKQAGGLKKFIFITTLFLFYNKIVCSSEIYDYQTDNLISEINKLILSVNNYKNKINYKIINDEFPNAFVTENNDIYISSGLIVNSPDYVALLAVIAHEIGHMENHHVAQRKTEINNLKSYNTFGNFLSIAGSMIIQKPELMNTIIFNQTAINNMYLNFSKDQEREADIYALNTLNKLKLSRKSIIHLLNILESKTKNDQLDDELKKFSTHPVFSERYKILDFNEQNKLKNFDTNIQNNFIFVKAKFMAYTNVENQNILSGDPKIYYQSIKLALSGNLLESLKKINFLILKNNENLFFIETKADILLSFGYESEAVKFYREVLKKYPDNNYIRFNIFIKSNYLNKDNYFLKKLFFDNLELIKLFPYNKDLLNKYYFLSKELKNKKWVKFFEILLSNNDQKKQLKEFYLKTQDNNLKKIIKIYI